MRDLGGRIDDRLIPAHAGKTRTVRALPSSAGAHPRSRGENLNAVAGGNKETGSSPLTRGKLQAARRGLEGMGLIPAHAGKTAAVRRRPGRVRAHPRSRGENSMFAASSAVWNGSSPLTRGKPARRRSPSST